MSLRTFLRYSRFVRRPQKMTKTQLLATHRIRSFMRQPIMASALRPQSATLADTPTSQTTYQIPGRAASWTRSMPMKLAPNPTLAYISKSIALAFAAHDTLAILPRTLVRC